MKIRTIENLLLCLIILTAFYLRVYKIDHHLHEGLFFEESSYIETVLTKNVSHVKMFNYPPFYTSFLNIINKTYYAFGLIKGHFKNFEEMVKAFNVKYSVDFTGLLLTHRIFTAVIGVSTVFILFMIAKTLFSGGAAALLSALFLAVIPLHIYTSMDAVGPDNLQVFFLLIAFLYICKIFKGGPKKEYYVLSGLFIGLAAATKYFGIFCAAPLFFAHFFSRGRKGNNYLYLGLGMIILTLSVTSLPSMAANFKDVISTFNFFVENYTKPVSIYNTIYQPLARKIGWISYPESLIFGLGIGVFFFFIAGLLLSVIRHTRQDIMILSFPLVYYLFIGNFYNCQVEYFLPAAPFIILTAVNFLMFISGKINGKRAGILILSAIVCAGVFFSLKETIYFKLWIYQGSIKKYAKNWILENIPANSVILMDGDNLGGDGQLRPFLFYKESPMSYKITVIDWEKTLKPEIFFKENEFDYVIINSRRPVLEKLKPFYKYIDTKFSLVKEFKPKFITPGYNCFSIYGVYYNQSFRIYKNSGG